LSTLLILKAEWFNSVVLIIVSLLQAAPATPRPIPRAAPVTIALLPLTSIIAFPPFGI
jgi:hypothetical protein